jgi:DNA-binding response OmpR family regulator
VREWLWHLSAGKVDGVPRVRETVILIGLAPDEIERVERCTPSAAIVSVPTLEDAVAWLEDAVHAVEVHGAPLAVDGLTIDLDLHRATWRDRDVPVTEQELGILACLASEPGRPRAFDELYEHAWGIPFVRDRAAVQAAVQRLRNKLAEHAPGIEIEAVRGFGFRMVAGPDSM